MGEISDLEAIRPVRKRSALDGGTMLLFVEGLQLEAEIGVYPHEKGRVQPLSIDFELRLGCSQFGPAVDLLEQTVDYDWAAQQVRRIVGETCFDLVETLAAEIAHFLFSHPLIEAVAIRIAKLHAIPGARAGVVFRLGCGGNAGSIPESRVEPFRMHCDR